MKVKISVDIHKEGNNNAHILAMVAANNGTNTIIDISDIKGFIQWKRIEYPNMNKDLSWRKDSGEDAINIYEEVGGPTLTLTWKEVHELVPAADENDLKDINI